VHRDHAPGLDEFARHHGGIERVHDELPATDGHPHALGLEPVGDELHVAEDPGIAYVPDLESVLEFDEEAARLAEIDLAGDAGELEGRLPESLHLNLAVGRMHGGGQGGEGQQRAQARGRIWMLCSRPESHL
jgi:hypothetical protein